MLAYFSRQVRENFICNFRLPQLNAMTDEEARFSRNFSPFINSLNAPPLMESFDRAASDIGRNANAKMVLLDTFIEIILNLRKQP